MIYNLEMKKIPKSFYLRNDVIQIAKDLLGKYIFSSENGYVCGGIITETEAYGGITDKASHAYGNRRTSRTETMYKEGGVAYVYLCYGIHSLFNIVTNIEDVPHAVLIRGFYPLHGSEKMLERTNKRKVDYYLCNGPGKVSKALGITTEQNSCDLEGDKIWLEDRGVVVPEKDIIKTKRIGIDYAEEDVDLLYRYLIEYNV